MYNNYDNYDNVKMLYDKFLEISKQGWIKGVCKGFGAAGHTFERALGKEIESFEIPDYEGIEIKTTRLQSERYITLFNAVPDSYLFEMKRLIDTYGIPDAHIPTANILATAVYAPYKLKKKNGYYFQLSVDKNKKQVTLLIFDEDKNLVDSDSAWSFDVLEEKLYRKLKRLAVVKNEAKMIHGEEYFRYTDIDFYELKDFDTFLFLIRKGIVRVCIRIGVFRSGKRYGQNHAHGCCFQILEKDLLHLYQKIEKEHYLGPRG